MELILLERVTRLGQMGEQVRVKDGYARNFLLPRGKALRATKANLALFAAERKAREAANDDKRKAAEAELAKLQKKLKDNMLVLVRQAGDTGQLYGSVSARDIVGALSEQKCAAKREQVTLNTAIKRLGLFEARLALHPEVEMTLTLNVARNTSEAKRQAAGEDVIATEQAKVRGKPAGQAKPAEDDAEGEATSGEGDEVAAEKDEATQPQEATDNNAEDESDEVAAEKDEAAAPEETLPKKEV